MIYCLAFIAANCLAWPQGRSASKSDISALIEARAARIKHCAIEYVDKQGASAQFHEGTARIKKSSVAAERDRWEQTVEAILLVNEPMHRLEVRTAGMDGKARMHSIFAANGEHFFHVKNIPQPGDAAPMDVDLGGKFADYYLRSTPVFRSLGIRLVGEPVETNRALSTWQVEIEAGSNIPGGQIACTFLPPEVKGTLRRRIRMLLEPKYGMCPTEIRMEATLTPEGGEFVTRTLIENQKFQSTGAPPFWYPAKFSERLLAPEGWVFSSSDIEIKSFQVDVNLPQSRFTPQIEMGANMFDYDTNRGWTYGNGPGARMLQAMEKNVRKAREDLMDAPPSAFIARPPENKLAFWILGGIGALLLGAAIALGVRRRFASH